MKFSEAMLKGFEKTEGRQCRGRNFIGNPEAPRAVCARGAVFLGLAGTAAYTTKTRHVADDAFLNFARPFERTWGFDLLFLNDGEELPWEHIYGMAVAAGL